METTSSRKAMRGSRWISITAIMTALALVGNYALVAFPNLELGSTVLFVTAYVFGAQVIGWFYIIAVGSIMGRRSDEGKRVDSKKWELAITGAFVTLMFDQITNLGYSATFPITFIFAVTAAIPFTVIHVVSNAVILSQVVPILDVALTRQLKDLIWSAEPEGKVENLESSMF